MHKFIYDFKHGVVPGKNISEAIHITHEAFHNIRNNKAKHVLLGMKLDLEKTYDNVNWNLLCFILKSQGFQNSWLQLTQNCITSSSLSLLINRKRTQAFQPDRTTKETKLKAIQFGLEDAKSRNFSKILCFGDNKDCIKALRERILYISNWITWWWILEFSLTVIFLIKIEQQLTMLTCSLN